MKQYLKHENLPWLTLLCGGIGMLLRIWLLSTENDLGFIARGHISEILLTILTVVFLALLGVACLSLSQGNKYRFNFPASMTSGIGIAVAALGCAVASIQELTAAADGVERVCALLGLVSTAILLFVGYCRWKGSRPSCLFHGILCVWLMVHLICLYRAWGSDPQLEDYCYQLLTLVFAMLTAYQRATFDANFGQRPAHAFFSLAGVYCCILSLSGPENRLLCLSLGLWMFCDLCRLTPMPRRYRRTQA